MANWVTEPKQTERHQCRFHFEFLKILENELGLKSLEVIVNGKT